MNKKEKETLVTQIATFMPELKAEIDGAKLDLKAARTQKTQLDSIVGSSNDLLDKLRDPVSGVNKLLQDGTTSVATISTNAEQSTKLLESIEATLTNATQHVAGMEKAYDDFIAIKKQIDDPETGLSVTLTNIKQVRARAKASATEAEKNLTIAEKTFTKLQTSIANIDVEYSRFLEAKKKVDDPTDGLEAILKSMKDLRDKISTTAEQSTTLFKQISGYKDEAVNSLNDIKKTEKNSSTSLENIQKHESESVVAKENIEKLLKIAAQESSTAYFKQRTLFVTVVAGLWLVLGIVALIVAVCLGSHLVNDVLNKDTQLDIVILRAVVITPLLVSTFYALRQYGKERNLAESYAFKEISGATVEGHVEMVRRAVPEASKLDDLLLGLIVRVVDDIHTEPNELNKSEISKTSVEANGKVIKLTNEIKEAIIKPRGVASRQAKVVEQVIDTTS